MGLNPLVCSGDVVVLGDYVYSWAGSTAVNSTAVKIVGFVDGEGGYKLP